MIFDPWHVLTANFGEVPKPYTAFATLLDIILYFVLMGRVGWARGKYKVEAPSTEGPTEFLCIFRVHQNTMEQLVMHLPLLWIAAYAMDDVFAAMLGLVWLFARVLYAVRYTKKAKRRFKGFAISMMANALLMLGAIAGTLAAL